MAGFYLKRNSRLKRVNLQDFAKLESFNSFMAEVPMI